MNALLAAFTYEPIQRWGPVSPHGLGTAAGFFAGAYLMARRAEPRGIPRNEVYNAVTWGALGAILGARGFYVLGHLDQFETWRDMLAVWEGGLTMFGGFVGGLAFGLAYLKRRHFDIAQALDAAAPGFVVGVIFGRIGDIIIADHLGRPTRFFLGYKIPPSGNVAPGYDPPTYSPGAVVHHTAVYDLVGAIVLMFVIYAIGRRRPRPGTLFASFALWYGIQRFLIDFTRNREAIETVFYGFSGSQWAGLAFAAAGLAALYRLSRRAPSPPAAPPVPFGPEPPPAAAPFEPPPLGIPPGPVPPAAPPTPPAPPWSPPSS
jgi:phosphatidylglycerol:prolipoprotein diacylglycerol transferase